MESAGPFYNKEAAGTTLVDTSSAEGKLPLTQTIYDAVGRAKEEIFKVGQTERWRSSTAYHGDHSRRTGRRNSRVRDYADIWTLTRSHDITAADLLTALAATSAHPRSTMSP